MIESVNQRFVYTSRAGNSVSVEQKCPQTRVQSPVCVSSIQSWIPGWRGRCHRPELLGWMPQSPDGSPDASLMNHATSGKVFNSDKDYPCHLLKWGRRLYSGLLQRDQDCYHREERSSSDSNTAMTMGISSQGAEWRISRWTLTRKRHQEWDGTPRGKISPSNAGLIPGPRAKILNASLPKSKNRKQKQTQ